MYSPEKGHNGDNGDMRAMTKEAGHQQEGKPVTDFTGTEAYQVTLTVNGQIQNVRFLQFLKKWAVSNNQVKKLVAELQTQRKTYHPATTRAALWYPKK